MTLLQTLPTRRNQTDHLIFQADALAPGCRRIGRQLEVSFDLELGTLWVFMRPEGVPCFNSELLAELLAFNRAINTNQGKVIVDGAPVRVQYYVLASRAPGVFNYGGDLAMFAQLAQAGRREELLRYATLCVDNLHQQTMSFNQPIITLALVQGAALGGGFEAVLANQVIIAERSSTFGFPEILFNLFPGMGAYTFLARLLSARRAEAMIASGATYTAAELAELGVVDVVADDGEGAAAASRFMRDSLRRYNGYSALLQVRRELFPISRDELMRVSTIWVDAVLQLKSQDIRIMQRLAKVQKKRNARLGSCYEAVDSE